MPDVTISENSKVTLGLLIAILIGVVSGAFFLFRIDSRVSSLEKSIPAVWMVQDQVVWELSVKSKNPSLILPNPNTISLARKKSIEN